MKKIGMRKHIKKVIRILLAVLIAITSFTMLPKTKVEAAIGSKRGLMFAETGLNHISNPQSPDASGWRGDYVYWGNRAMKWQILNKTSSELLLLSGNIGQSILSPENVDGYEGQSLDTFLIEEYYKQTSVDEQRATLATSNSDDYTFAIGSDQFRDFRFSNKGWYAPTSRMMLNSSYGFSNNPSANDSARQTNSNQEYWLSTGVPSRTVESNVNRYGGSVSTGGSWNVTNTRIFLKVRAATRINPTSVLLVSAANGGKEGDTGGILAPIDNTATNEWKLTLKDSGQTISKPRVKRIAKDKIEVTFNKTGQGTSLSAVVTNEDGTDIMNYSRVDSVRAGNVTDAKVTITLPKKVTDGSNYKLKLFTEKYVDETTTDYGSNMIDITVPDFEVTGTYQYRNADGEMAPEVETVYKGGLKFDDLAKPTLDSFVTGYRLTDVANPWLITPIIDKEKVELDFTATAQYTKTYQVKVFAGVDGTTPYFNGTVDTDRNLQEDGVVGSSPDGIHKVEVVNPVAPTGYRFDGWAYTDKDGNPISGVDVGKANVENVQMDFIAKAKFVKIFDVEFSDGQGDAESNRVEVELEDGTLVGKQVIDIGGNAIVPKKIPIKPYYHFSQWNSAFNIQADKTLLGNNPITPIYSPYSFTIDSLYSLYAYTEEEATAMFSILSNAEIEAILVAQYAPNVYRDGILQSFGEEKSPNDGSYKDKVTIKNVDHDALRSGSKGKHKFTLEYSNSTALTLDPNEEAFKDEKAAVIKIADNANSETKARIAADDFTINVNEVKSIWLTNVVQLASAQSFGDDGTIGVVRVDATSLESLPNVPGIYPLVFTSQVASNGTTKEVKTTVKVTIKDNSGVDNDAEEQINGNNFNIPLDKASTTIVDDTELIKLGNIEAVNMEQGRSVPVMVSDKSNLKAEKGEYVVTFKTTTPGKNTVVSIIVNVVDKEETSGTEKISGNHFTMRSSEVTALLELTDKDIKEQLITLGKVTAKDTTTLENLTVNVDYTTLKEKSGVYDIVYTTNKGTTLLVQATVSDGSVINGDEQIIADDFTILTSDVTDVNLTDRKLIAYGNASAKNIKTNAGIAIDKVEHTIIKKAGDYKVTYSTAKPTSITANVHVRDVIEDKANESISGNNFMIKTGDVATLDDTKLMILANVKAMNTDKKLPIPVTVKENKLETFQGEYDVTFTTGNADLKVKVTVRDEIITNDKTREVISGNNFDVLLAEVETLDSDAIIALAKVKAYNIDTNLEVDITSVEHAIKALEGVYPVTFKTDTGTTLTLNASVREKSVEANGERISGNRFIIKTEDAKSLKDSDFIALGKVKAITLTTGKEAEITVDKSKFKASRGIYEITYQTKKGTALTLEAEVRDEVIENIETREKIVANHVYLGVEDVATLDNEKLKQLTNVKAYNIDTKKEVDIVSVRHNVKAEKGVYWVQFATKKGTTIRVNVVVEEAVIEDSKNQERITGSAFRVKTEEASGLTSEDFITLGNVKAMDTTTGELVEVSVDSKDYKAEPGSYTIIYKTKKGTMLTLKATVYDTIVNERIIGKDIYLSIEEAKNIDDKKLQVKGKVRAVDINSNKEIALTKFTNTIEAEKGIYEATFETELGTMLLVDVYVNNENKLETSLGEQITGNQITVRPEDISKLDEVVIITLGNIKAINLGTGKFVNVYVDKSALQEKEGIYAIALSTSEGTKASIDVEVKEDAPVMEEMLGQPNVIMSEVLVPEKDVYTYQTRVRDEKVANEAIDESTSKDVKQVEQKINISERNAKGEAQEKVGNIMWVIMALYGVYMASRVYIRKKVVE